MRMVRETRWTTWGTVSSAFREIELRGDRLESVEHLAPFLAPADAPRLPLVHPQPTSYRALSVLPRRIATLNAARFAQQFDAGVVLLQQTIARLKRDAPQHLQLWAETNYVAFTYDLLIFGAGEADRTEEQDFEVGRDAWVDEVERLRRRVTGR